MCINRLNLKCQRRLVYKQKAHVGSRQGKRGISDRVLHLPFIFSTWTINPSVFQGFISAFHFPLRASESGVKRKGIKQSHSFCCLLNVQLPSPTKEKCNVSKAMNRKSTTAVVQRGFRCASHKFFSAAASLITLAVLSC